jgi:hypothetical protein
MPFKVLAWFACVVAVTLGAYTNLKIIRPTPHNLNAAEWA